MTLTAFLKKLLTAFVDVYEKLFFKTFRVAVLWTIFCFAIALLLAKYSEYDPTSKTHSVSILSYFLTRFSYKETYSYVDLVKTVFIFFVSIFSIKLLQNKVSLKAFLHLFATLIVCVFLDCALFRFKGQLHEELNGNINAVLWVGNIIFYLRLYMPLVLFALIIQICTSKAEFTLKKIILLLVSLWLFNEFAYEFTLLFRYTVIDLIQIPFKGASAYYTVESILGLPLTAAFFLGFYCAMTAPFTILEEKYIEV
jgi:hypothetical protein